MSQSTPESELAELDIPTLLRAGLAQEGERHVELFGNGVVGAAVVLDRLHVIPRSLTYLAHVVRSGGVRAAAGLAEPLPQPAQTEAIRPWLAGAAATVTTVDGDEDMARWLEAVSTIVAARLGARGERPTLG
jgi:hypothetical protein